VKHNFLFLDFDGVLHPEPGYSKDELFCKLPLFEATIRDFPNVDIVISSTWRQTYEFVALQAIFSEDIGERVIGVTPNWNDVAKLPLSILPYRRQAEIEGWLRQSDQAWRPWLALDDRAYLFKPFQPNLVRCHPITGLVQETVLELRKKLKGRT
jgi:hypothetical protein